MQYEQEDGSYPWDTSGVSPGTYYVEVNVFDSMGQVTSTSSPNSFDILPGDSPPIVDSWEPGGTVGQSFVEGTVVQVQWTASDDNAMPANNINITYGSGATWSDVVRDTTNDGVHDWDTSAVPPGNYFINVTAYDSIGQTSWDVGNFTFEITSLTNLPPTVVLFFSKVGESLSGGTLTSFMWDMSDDATAVQDLIVYANYSHSGGGGPIFGPQTGFAGTNFYPWTLPLINATDVVIEIDVIDEGGLEGSSVSGQFEIDSTPPTVDWTNPVNGQSSVPRNTNVEAQWSEGMNQSATESSFELLDNSTWLPVPGSIGWIGNSFIFNPDSDLAGDSWYTANFTTLAMDDSEPGNPLPGIYSWSFRTMPIPDTLPPEIADVQAPSPQEVHFNVNVSAVVTDDFSVGAVTLNVTGPSGNWNLSMSYDSGRYYLDATYDQIGTHFFMIFATDSSGNLNSSSGQFTIVDTTLPQLTSLTVVPSVPEVFTNANISIVAQDNYQLLGVWIDIVGIGNYTMSYDSASGRFYDERMHSTLGTFDFAIWASDTSDNWNSTSGNFLVEDRTEPIISHSPISTWSAFTPLTIQATVTDSFLDDVRLDYVDVSMGSFNVTMSPTGGDNYAYTVPTQFAAGTLFYFIWANDTSSNMASTSVHNVNILLDDNPPGISDVTATPNPQEVFGDVNISARIVDDYGLQSVFVDITWPDSSSINVSMIAGSGDYFSHMGSYDQLGFYSFTIWVGDTSDRWASSAGSFGIVDSTPPVISHTPLGSQAVGTAISFTAMVTDNVLVSGVRVNYTDTLGIPYSEVMSLLASDVFTFLAGIQTEPGNITYSFWAEDSSGNQIQSSAFVVEITETRPLPPTNLTVVTTSKSSVSLEWDAPTRNVDGSQLTDLMGYNLYRRSDPSGQLARVNTQVIQGSSFLDTDLRQGETYYYVVRAVNSRGLESDDSNEAVGTTQDSEETDFFPVIVLLMVIVIVLAVVLLLFLRRRKKDEEEPEEAESLSRE